MEIKQGDKVRVSKDAPKLIFGGCDMSQIVCTVCCVDKDVAAINMINDERTEMKVWIIPTKYLVKVDAEAFRLADVVSDAGLHQDNYLNEDKKEPKFKVGDKVRMKDGYYKEELHGCIGTIIKIDKCHIYVEIDSTIYPATIHSIEHYTEPTAPTIKVGDRVRSKGYGLEAVVLGIDGEFIAVRRDDGIKQEWNISITELVEPTEQTEAEKDANEELQDRYAPFSFSDRIERNHILHRLRVISQDDFLKEINPTEHEVNPKPRYVPKIMFNTEFWVKYEADLAKEVVLKVANKYNDPEQAAEYAVSVAKAVVKNLKQK